MPINTIPEDSTIATVWPGLTHRHAYVRGVLDKLRKCKKENGNAAVRIGVTGTGQKPYYRIFYFSDNGGEAVITGSYFDTHAPFDETQVAMTDNWSSQHMDFSEVAEFFAEKIGWKGKKV